MEQKSCPEINTCSIRLKVWALLVSLMLSLIKGIIGILGKSEALVADGLYSFYQSFICARSLLNRKDFRLGFTGLVIGLMLILGTIDVFIFSIVNLFKSARGLLVEPSPYALCAAIISVLANHLLWRYSNCIEHQPQGEKVTHLHRSFRLSVITSSIVLIGVALGRYGWLSADTLATIIVVGLLIKPVLGLFYPANTLLKPSI